MRVTERVDLYRERHRYGRFPQPKNGRNDGHWNGSPPSIHTIPRITLNLSSEWTCLFNFGHVPYNPP